MKCKRAKCGVTFTPRSPRQEYHTPSCADADRHARHRKNNKRYRKNNAERMRVARRLKRAVIVETCLVVMCAPLIATIEMCPECERPFPCVPGQQYCKPSCRESAKKQRVMLRDP